MRNGLLLMIISAVLTICLVAWVLVDGPPSRASPDRAGGISEKSVPR